MNIYKFKAVTDSFRLQSKYFFSRFENKSEKARKSFSKREKTFPKMRNTFYKAQKKGCQTGNPKLLFLNQPQFPFLLRESCHQVFSDFLPYISLLR